MLAPSPLKLLRWWVNKRIKKSHAWSTGGYCPPAYYFIVSATHTCVAFVDHLSLLSQTFVKPFCRQRHSRFLSLSFSRRQRVQRPYKQQIVSMVEPWSLWVIPVTYPHICRTVWKHTINVDSVVIVSSPYAISETCASISNLSNNRYKRTVTEAYESQLNSPISPIVFRTKI